MVPSICRASIGVVVFSPPPRCLTVILPCALRPAVFFKDTTKDFSKYTFLVHPDATKSQIKEAVEKMFEGTKVKGVNTMNLDGKTRLFSLKILLRIFPEQIL